jgi:hypothetical protein
MAHSIAAHGQLVGQTQSTEGQANDHATRAVEMNSGPWLAITGPLMIALTVIVVSWLSKISF